MKVSDLFNIEYGNGFALTELTPVDNGINFISRTEKNNGISGVVEKVQDIEPFGAGLITVAVSGSVLESFVQFKPFYTGYHIMVLEPKNTMTINEKLFYCMCIKRNKFKYSYGRQANRTLKDIKLPKTPDWVHKFDSSKFENIQKPLNKSNISLKDRRWGVFYYAEVFDIERGYYNKRPEKVGNINFVSASMFNNGVTDKIASDAIEKMYNGNCVAVVNNGHAAEAFYQKDDFTCSHDVNILRIKDGEMTPYLAMFLIPIIRKEKYRFNYGRKWRFRRMERSTIKLPITESKKPDWQFMENFIKSLPYSGAIGN